METQQLSWVFCKLNHLHVCFFQSVPEHERPEKLLAILLKRDDELVSVFLKALVETDQLHVARMLGYQGWIYFLCYLMLYLYSRSR